MRVSSAGKQILNILFKIGNFVSEKIFKDSVY